MKKMLRFEVIDYGFGPQPADDARLTLEGADFNDYHLGSGWHRKEALQSAIELIEEQGVQASDKLVKEMEKAETRKSAKDERWNLAVRFYYDRAKEDAEFDANILRLIEEKRLARQALIDSGELSEDEELGLVG